jgi:N-acetylglutamate synthase-like GNAT family acetyltransferase
MLAIRPFSPRDAEGVASVILPIQQEEFGIPITLDAQPDLRDIPAFYQQNSGNFWVAQADEKIVGTIGLLDIGQAQGALRKMFVAQSHRGREHGVAKRLLDTLLDWAEVRGIAEIYLGTTDKFLAAHRFYEKNGFSEVDRATLPASFPVMAVDTRFYRRRLGASAE